MALFWVMTTELRAFGSREGRLISLSSSRYIISFLHSPPFSKAVSVPRCLRAAGLQRVAETRPPQRGRHESCTFDEWKSYILTALLRTVQAFCSQANISLFLSI